MKWLLFTPFNFRFWCVLGFAAWLATLAAGGGGYSSFSSYSDLNSGSPSGAAFGETNVRQLCEDVQSWLALHAPLIVTSVLVLFALGIAVGIALLWIQSRGRFVFLDCVVNERCGIRRPWAMFRQHGNSLFKWLLVYSIILMIVGFILLTVLVLGVLRPLFVNWDYELASLLQLLGDGAFWMIVVLWLILMLFALGVQWVIGDFIVPLMYNSDLTASEAWRRFLPLLRAHTGSILLYGIMRWLLGLAAGIAGAIAMALLYVVSCCLLFCLVAIPYVGGYVSCIILLPIHVFFRGYSIEYLAQFGDAYRLRTEAEREVAGASDD